MSDFDPLFIELSAPRPFIPRYLRILAALHTQPWAIRPEDFDQMHRIVMEHSSPEYVKADLEAVAAKVGRPLENTGGQVRMRGSTAILAIEGPIFRYANLMTAISGATSVESAALAFDAAVESPAVSQIVLQINSPGGEVDGINAFADQIRGGAIRKPVTAYVEGLGASAAYWLASSARRIVADESARLGSIGVIATQTDRTGAQERQGIKSYKIISSQSPKKGADAGTPEGRSQIQAMVDEMADLFIGKVAKFRGITPDQVANDFGQGATMMAPKALEAGMIDQVTSFEPFLQTLDPRSVVSIPAAPAALEEVHMADSTIPALPAATSPPSASNNVITTTGSNTGPSSVITGVVVVEPNAERQRIRSILECAEAEGREGLARYLAFQTNDDLDKARGILSASPKTPPAIPIPPRANAFEQAMSRIPNPQVGLGSDEEDQSPAAEAARILRFVGKPRPVAV